MVPFLALVVFAATVFGQGTHYMYGQAWGWYSIRTSGYIKSLETTLTPGAPPNPAQRRLAIWPGMNVPRGLIQPIIVSSDEPLYLGSQCGGATTKQWCAFASQLTGSQRMGKRFPLNGDDKLNMKFIWNDTLQGYNQYLSVGGKLMSELHIGSGKAKSFYVDTECQEYHKGTVNAHTYSDTTLVFSEPVPGLDKMINMAERACADSVASSDGGKTWKIPNIKVQKAEAPGHYYKGAKLVSKGQICPK